MVSSGTKRSWAQKQIRYERQRIPTEEILKELSNPETLVSFDVKGLLPSIPAQEEELHFQVRFYKITLGIPMTNLLSRLLSKILEHLLCKMEVNMGNEGIVSPFWVNDVDDVLGQKVRHKFAKLDPVPMAFLTIFSKIPSTHFLLHLCITFKKSLDFHFSKFSLSLYTKLQTTFLTRIITLFLLVYSCSKIPFSPFPSVPQESI